MPDFHQLAAQIKGRARAVGFDRVGIASVEPSKYRRYFQDWLDDGQAGSMDYLQKRFAERVDPAAYLPGVASAVCVAMNYFYPLEPLSAEDQKHHGKIARYALGDDYHQIIQPRLRGLADWIRQIAPEARTRSAVDTAPVMEKDLAARAGVGWVGKNTCLINPEIGSWLLLGEILTTLPLPPDEPAADRCGSCRRCLDACPTGALTAPYQLDARLCISYLTIEHRGPIPPELQPQIENWLYGCDICQDVCPFNRDIPTVSDPALKPRFPTGSLDLREVENWELDDYRGRLRNSAMKRVKLPILQRNAKIVQTNLAR